MLSVPVFNESGQKIGDEQIDATMLGGAVNAPLLKQAIVMYQANARQGTVRQKSRGEVAGSTRKLYKQKGTGRARQGNLRQPVRVGGGRAFPRRPLDYRQDMPKKMRRLARNQAVLAKIQSEQAIIVDGVSFDAPRTKRFAAMLGALNSERGCTFATAGRDANLYKSGRNIPNTNIMDVADLNAYCVLARRHLIFTRDAFNAFRQLVSDATAKAGA
ncbi:MAG: 50S ribosomal protein L4 [Phycisphaerales bacterium]|nr:50S ribosomal protein L4 [Phycisphaerales bacterium]